MFISPHISSHRSSTGTSIRRPGQRQTSATRFTLPVVFGAGFALMMKATRYEEEHINPKIEAMVSFSAAPAVNQALEALDRGDAVMAERKLRPISLETAK